MGKAFETSTTQGTSGTSQTAPWAPQQQPVLNVLGSANDLLNSQKDGALSSGQQNDLNNLISNGQASRDLADSLRGYGTTAVGGLPQAQATASGLASGDFTHAQTGGGYQAMANIPNSLNQANTGINSALTIANGDTTGQNINAAGQYASNPYLDGQIDAASRDITRNLGEQVLPGLNLAASAGDNLNSSRAGAAEAIARRGAADRLGDISSQIRGQAYQQGLSLAEQARQANLTGNLGAANAGTALTNTGIAGQTASNQSQQADLGIQAAGAGLLNQQGAIGTGMLTASDTLGASGANQMLTADTIRQQAPWQLLNNASGVIQGRNWGSSTDTSGTVTKTDAGNPVGGALSLASAAGSLFGGSGTNGQGPSAASNIASAVGKGYDALSNGVGALTNYLGW